MGLDELLARRDLVAHQPLERLVGHGSSPHDPDCLERARRGDSLASRYKLGVELAFDVLTPLGFRVRCARDWWEYIATAKHPVLRNRLQDIVATLAEPLQIRRSIRDPAVLLFYRAAPPRLLCAVIRNEDGSGFLITAYPTDALKRGDIVWSGSE